MWLIIDDGSDDDTEVVVKSFQNSNPDFLIQYIRKQNGGLHTAYNTAIENANTELCMCIDSDDWVADGAVDRIISAWQTAKRSDCAGIVGLDAYEDGTPTCWINSPNTYINLNEYDATHKWAGDRKLVIRTDLYKSVAPMPSFEGEKNFNPQYMHIKIAEKYSFYVLNEVLCIVDYQETGMSARIFKQYVDSPNSFAEYRRLKMTVKPNSARAIVRNAIHYDSSCFLAGKPSSIILASPRKLLTTLLSPLGLVFSVYVRHRSK